MEPTPQLVFGPFRLDPTQACLWRREQAISLRPRTFAVLHYLAAHPSRLVTQAELFQQVWSRRHVSGSVLRVCIHEIRTALGDDAEAPQYIETVGRQGYRFLSGHTSQGPSLTSARPVVGRQHEVAQLHRWYARAVGGARQFVVLSGELGIGKTTVVDLFLASLAPESRIGRGQCVEHYGEGEPYLPLLEALGRLGHEPGGNRMVAVLQRYAPLWLVQLAGLVSEIELERVQRRVEGATAVRMLRELAEALEVVTTETPLVLVLEDLHWSDRATLELLGYLAQRRGPARLLVLGTYRSADAVARAHPVRELVQELRGRGMCRELALELLTVSEVASYMAGHLGGPVTSALAELVYRHTEGNALFMVNIVEHLVQQGLVTRREGQWTLREGAEATSLPEGLRQLLGRRIEALPPETQRMLEAASVAGEAFAVAAVAAGVQDSVANVEAQCEELAAQHHFIDDIGLVVWPDGTSGGRYRFQHALYQQVLSERLGTARRVQLHRCIGARLEAGYGNRAGEMAAQLAVHFERGGETQPAVHYWQQAGDNAARRNAYHEAIAAIKNGIKLLASLPDNPERTQQELTLQLTLGGLLIAARGRASPEVGDVYTRARALCQQVEETPQRFRALRGLFLFHGAQAQLRTADEMSQELLQLAQRQADPGLLLEAHLAAGFVALYYGHLVAARVHLEHSRRLWNTQQLPLPSLYDGYDSRVTNLDWMALVLWELGDADQAQQWNQEALALASRVGHTPTVGFAHFYAARLAHCRRDVTATQAYAEALMAFAAEQGFALRLEQGRILRGWALAMQGDAPEGVAQIREGWAVYLDVGPKMMRPYFLSLLAEAHAQAGQPEAGLQAVAEALTLVEATEERWWEAELSRLKGALLLQLQTSDAAQAEACFQHALDVARSQQSKALELRAALNLSQLWHEQNRRDEARQLLTELYDWFTEGFDTPDLQEAQALLDA